MAGKTKSYGKRMDLVWTSYKRAEKSRGTRVCLKKQDKQNYLYHAFYFLPEQEVLKITKASLRSAERLPSGAQTAPSRRVVSDLLLVYLVNDDNLGK